MSTTRRGLSATLPLILILLFTLLVALGGGELYARHAIGEKIAAAISAEINEECLSAAASTSATATPDDPAASNHPCSRTGVPVKTSFSATPILFSVPSRMLPHITVKIGPLPATDVRAGTLVHFTATDISYTDINNPHFASANATLTIPPQALENIINDDLSQQRGVFFPGLEVSTITYQPTHGTILVELSDGAATLTIAPAVKNGNFVFQLRDMSVAGFHHPSMVRQMRDMVPELSGAYLQLLPPSFSAQSVTVNSTTITVELKGENFTSKDLAQFGGNEE